MDFYADEFRLITGETARLLHPSIAATLKLLAHRHRARGRGQGGLEPGWNAEPLPVHPAQAHRVPWALPL